MPLDDIRAQVEKLRPQPGDLITLTLSRQLTHEELDTVRDMLYRILPAGCKACESPERNAAMASALQRRTRSDGPCQPISVEMCASPSTSPSSACRETKP